MIREKRLSPRRAKSRLPLSPRANSRLRLKPLLFLRPLPLQRRHTKRARLARFCTHYEYPIFDARSEGLRSSVRLRRMSSWSHGAARQQEYRLRLKRPTPIRRGGRFPPFKSSTRLGKLAALARTPFCAMLKRQLAFPFWKEKLRLAYFFSPKRNPKDPRREGENKGQRPNPADAG